MHDPGRIYPFLPVLAGISLVTFILVCCCTSPVPPGEKPVTLDTTGGTSWIDTPLSDMEGNGIFSIRNMTGRPVLIPVLSDECPSCVALLVRQLDEIEREPGVQNGSITVVALDLGPALGPGFIASHPVKSGFTGYTARAPENMTLGILDGLGPFAVDTSQAPLILVCPQKEAILLPPGLKTAAVLSTTIAREC